MAYIDQPLKKKLMPGIKAALKEHGFKGSVRIRHHSTLILTITEGPYEVPERLKGVNPYWFRQHPYHPMVKAFLNDVMKAMNEGNWDNSDLQSDYVNVGWYTDITFGDHKRPYICVGGTPAILEGES